MHETFSGDIHGVVQRNGAHYSWYLPQDKRARSESNSTMVIKSRIVASACICNGKAEKAAQTSSGVKQSSPKYLFKRHNMDHLIGMQFLESCRLSQRHLRISRVSSSPAQKMKPVQGLVEYALIIALVAFAAVIGMNTPGRRISTLLSARSGQ